MHPQLTFAANEPQTLTLKYPAGKEVASKGPGKRFMFTTTQDEVFFVDQDVAGQIHALQLRPGQSLTICRKETAANGKGKEILWQLTKPAEPEPSAKIGPGSAQSARTQCPKSSRTETANQPPLSTPQTQYVSRQLIGAIEAAHAAEKYAQSIGRPVEFKSEDIRAIAITCFIEGARYSNAA